MKRIIVTILCGTAALAVLSHWTTPRKSTATAPFFQARAAENDWGYTCSTQAAKGSYGQTLTGTVAGFGNVAGVGTAVLDGAGHFSGNVTGVATIAGVSTTHSSRTTGTYVLKSDCSGTFTINFVDLSFSVSGSMVVVNDGNDAQAVVTSPSTAQLTGTIRRQ